MRVVRVYHAGRDAAHRERDRALARAGVEVTLVVPAAWPGPDDAAVDEPFDVVALPVRRPGDVNRHRFVEPAALRDVVERVRPDVLDLHEEPFSHVVRQALTNVPDRVPAVTYAAQNVDKRFPPPFAQWERAAYARLAGVYPCTRQAASVVTGKGFTGAVEVLPLAPSNLIVPGAQEPPEDSLHMLLVGRLVPEKGVADAVRVLAALRGKATLTVVGDGPEREPARALAAQLGVGAALTLVPWTDAAHLAQYYADAQILLVPSSTTRTWTEQFGRTVVEAHAAGAVVAGYASGALPEVVDAAGVLVPQGDSAALAAAVAALANDPSRWTALREAGLRRAAQRTWDTVAAGQLALYERAAATAPARRPVRPRRALAVERYGAPARLDGATRPFALPVLRRDNTATRTLARAIDSVARKDAPGSTDRIKVVYLDHVARMSGGEVALARLIAGLPDVDAHVVLAEDGPLRDVLLRAGASVEVLELDPRTRDARRAQVGRTGTVRLGLSTLGYTWRVARRLRQLQPDIVHTNSLKAGYYGSVAARLARRRVIWHLRDRLADDYLPPRAIWLTRTLLRTLPDLVICNSAETLHAARINTSSATVVASPVVHDPYEGSAQRRTTGEWPVIGIVGRLAPWKGQELFLRAFAPIAREHPGVRARVIGAALFGEDDYAAGLPLLARELGLDGQVAFTGHVDDVERELAQLDILVHASLTPEPFGQVIVEGMAAGLAVVAAAAGGPVEIITDEVDGLLYRPGDTAALTAALRRLVVDPQLRDRLGRAGMRRARDFSPERIGQEMQAIYRELLGAPRR